MAAVRRLTMVYDADGTVLGEVRYAVGHLLGRARCDLCDITHGGLRRRETFDALVARLPVPVDVVHRDQQDEAVRAVTAGRLACVVAHTDHGPEVLLTQSELAGCDGRVDALARLLDERLAGRMGAPAT